MLVRPLAVVGALVVLGSTATALGSRPTGSAAATQRCFNFTVVQPDPAAGFAAGVYHRRNWPEQLAELQHDVRRVPQLPTPRPTAAGRSTPSSGRCARHRQALRRAAPTG